MRILLLLVLVAGVWCQRPGRPLQCGAVGRHKHLEMQNPAQLPRECVYRILPINDHVCQLRVDFNIILSQPTLPTGTEKGVPRCVTDVFNITGLELCGINRNQHVYIPVHVTRENRRNTIDMTFRIADRKTNPMLSFVTWSIRVTQLECARNTPAVITGRLEDSPVPMTPALARSIITDVDLLAPHGCLQYHHAAEGTIESFNFNGGIGPYPPSMKYAICLRRRQANSRIEFTFNSFNMSSVKTETEGFDDNCLAKTLKPPGGGGNSRAETAPPNEDYLMIPSSTTSEKKLRVNKFCGNTIHKQTVTANAPGPYVLQFHSDDQFKAPDDKAREGGFNLSYKIE